MENLLVTFLPYLLLILSLFQAFNFITRGSKPRSGKFPPGPKPLPLIGNLLDLGDKPHQSLANFAKIHGPLMSLKLGQVTTIVVSSANLAKEVLQTHDLLLCNRTVVDAVTALQHHEDALPWLPVGPRWRNLRKVSNSYIFTSQKLDANQELRRKMIRQLLQHVQECCRSGKAVNIGEMSFKTTLNALSNTIFSLDLMVDTYETAELKHIVRNIMDEALKPNVSDYFPVLRRFDVQGIRRRMSVYFAKLDDLFDRIIEERVRLRKVEGYNPVNDMLDTLLDISEQNSRDMDKQRMKHLVVVLFVAGTDTTSSTVEWAMAELLRNPKTLSKAQEELRQTIGKGRLVEESDIGRLPYLQAVIKETFRLHPAVPLLLPRKAGSDVDINGLTIPKDAQVFVNLWAMGRDPGTWENPLSFEPERFLKSEVDAGGRSFELIPFGSGRRICPGLPLAMRMLHLILGSLVMSFDWKLEDGVTPQSLDMEEKFGLTLQMPQPLQAVPLQI